MYNALRRGVSDILNDKTEKEKQTLKPFVCTYFFNYHGDLNIVILLSKISNSNLQRTMEVVVLVQ